MCRLSESALKNWISRKPRKKNENFQKLCSARHTSPQDDETSVVNMSDASVQTEVDEIDTAIKRLNLLPNTDKGCTESDKSDIDSDFEFD